MLLQYQYEFQTNLLKTLHSANRVDLLLRRLAAPWLFYVPDK